MGSAAPENFVAGKSPASAAPVCSNLHQSAPTRKDKGYFTGKKQAAQAQKVLLDAATEQVGQSCRTKAVTANDFESAAAWSGNRHHANAYPEEARHWYSRCRPCMSCRILQNLAELASGNSAYPPALEDKVVALIREEFGAVVRASRKFPMAYNHFSHQHGHTLRLNSPFLQTNHDKPSFHMFSWSIYNI